MKFYTLIFCFGAGMLQNAMERSSLQMKQWMFWTLQVIPVAATIAELFIAFRSFRWWSLLICYGFFGLPDFIFPSRLGRNPVPFFCIGVLATVIATGLIVLH